MLRKNPPEEKCPWLVPQWSPSSTNTLTGEDWRDRPLTAAMARTARFHLMRQPPLELAAKQQAAYCARHVLPTLAQSCGLLETEKAALSNWRDMRSSEAASAAASMANLYSQSKAQTQLASKLMLIRSTRAAMEALADANLPWAEYISKLPPVDGLRSQALADSADVTPPEGVSEASLEAARVPWSTIRDSDAKSDTTDEAASSSGSSADSDPRENDQTALGESTLREACSTPTV